MATSELKVINKSLEPPCQQLEELLQESEERFRLIADAIPVMIWMAGYDQLYDYFNQVWLEFTGCSLEQQLGNGWTQGVHPEDKEQRQTIYSTAFQARRKFQIEYRLRRADGEYRWVIDTGVPRLTPKGSFVGYIGSCVDVTERKQAEEKVRQKTAEQHAILQVLPDLYFQLNSDGTILDYNAKNRSDLYVSPEIFLGKRMQDVLPPGLSEQFQQSLSQSFQSNTLVSLEYSLPLENRERIFEARIVPLHDRQTIVIVREITARVAAEADLKRAIKQLQNEMAHRVQVQEVLVKQQQQQQVILDSVPAMIWFKDRENRILRVNQAAAMAIGLPVEEIEGKSTHEIYPNEAAKYYQDDLEVINSNSSKLGIIELIRTASGEIRWVQTDKIPWRDSDGNVAGVLVLAVDVTERQQAEESLRRSEERYRQLAQQKELLYRISSQIRNSLDLDTILETAVAEIRSLLQIDRCLFSWYRVQSQSAVWEVVHEATQTDMPSLVGCYPAETLKPLVEPLLNLEILRVDEVQSLQDEAARQFFQALGYSSVLNLPIQTPCGEVGIVTCANYNRSRPWADEEVELLKAVCDQLAIAINQAELYAQSITAATVATDKATQLELALRSLQQTQTQLIQTEKMSSLGQLVAGIAHEINNPVSFISGNVDHAYNYIKDLLKLLELYRAAYPQPLPEIQDIAKTVDLDFLVEDLPKALGSMKVGADRIRDLVLSLRNFSRLDESEMKPADIHQGLDNTLLILQHRLKGKAGYPVIEVIKEYGQLPLVNCYPGQLNQVFMNLLSNGIDALEESAVSANTLENGQCITDKQPTLRICTEFNDSGCITIRVADNGAGMTEGVRSRLFDPFFTTKPIGKGTGLGLSISYQIVVGKHKGTLHCQSELGKGTEFVVTIPQ